jgi:hypothetical protein
MNEPDTGEDNPPKGYKSCIAFWKKHAFWENETTDKIPCMNASCKRKKGEHGAHVRVFAKIKVSKSSITIEEYKEPSLYIVPLCEYHNNSERVEPFIVKGPLVPLDFDEHINSAFRVLR